MRARKAKDVFFIWNKYGYQLNEQQCAAFSQKGAEFTVTLENTCVGCGKCSEVCPVKNIVIKDNKPVWGNKCEFCLACLNSCPKGAINYGYSKGKRRYTFPAASIKK